MTQDNAMGGRYLAELSRDTWILMCVLDIGLLKKLQIEAGGDVSKLVNPPASHDHAIYFNNL